MAENKSSISQKIPAIPNFERASHGVSQTLPKLGQAFGNLIAGPEPRPRNLSARYFLDKKAQRRQEHPNTVAALYARLAEQVEREHFARTPSMPNPEVGFEN